MNWIYTVVEIEGKEWTYAMALESDNETIAQEIEKHLINDLCDNNIKDFIELGISEGYFNKAEIARARGKSQTHSSTQYPSFLAKIEDIENCLTNLGYRIKIKKS